MARIVERVRAVANDPGSDRSLATRLRARRWSLLQAELPEIEDMHVLDLGGTVQTWSAAPVTPASVTIVNLQPQPPAPRSTVTSIVGDVCCLPSAVVSRSFDLVFSNSVIEHVGGHAKRMEMAKSVRSLAPHHWVQTPYRYFPIEPHMLFPGFQFLPPVAQVQVARRWPFAWAQPTGRAAVGVALEVELLTRTQMTFYFPSSRLLTERFGGLPKSLIAMA